VDTSGNASAWSDTQVAAPRYIEALDIGQAVIGTAHIGDAQITTAKIQDAAITTAKIQDAAITDAKIANAAIKTAHIDDAQITTAKIQDAAITTAKIQDAAITDAKIANAAIKTAHIDDAQITTAKIQDAAITTAKIQDAAITDAKIANAAIKTAHIDDAQITNAHIIDLSAEKITAGYISSDRIAAGGILAHHIAADSISSDKIKAGAVTAGKIAAEAVTADNLQAGAVTAGKIAAGAVTTDNLQAGSVTAEKVAADSIDGTHIKSESIGGQHISAGSITGTHISTLDISGKTLTADSGSIAGWLLSQDAFKSALSGSRVEISKALNRISIFDAVNEKVVMGYLDGLPKNDGTGNWTAADYGFWARSGDHLAIDGDVIYNSGDWLIEHDGNLRIRDASGNTIVLLGSYNGEKGLFIFDSLGNLLGKYTSDGFHVGDSEYIHYESGELSYVGRVIDKTPWLDKTQDFTFEPGGRYRVDTSTGSIYGTLPASPNENDTVYWIDASRSFGTNPFYIDPNGSKVEGYTLSIGEYFICQNDGEGGGLLYTGVDYGWKLI
jgi:hypothetical protein